MVKESECHCDCHWTGAVHVVACCDGGFLAPIIRQKQEARVVKAALALHETWEGEADCPVCQEFADACEALKASLSPSELDPELEAAGVEFMLSQMKEENEKDQ